ncbi:unnamed protein product [Durusdinium trenchii]|uniref:Poly [ADP-ribose] polymerase n=1 Tax=Durusdinium trenchii TaxID=1381693 RepID=A0ABP0KG35_9DINO
MDCLDRHLAANIYHWPEALGNVNATNQLKSVARSATWPPANSADSVDSANCDNGRESRSQGSGSRGARTVDHLKEPEVCDVESRKDVAMLNFKELHKLNAKLKALCHVQKELIANLEAQAILKNEDRESMMCVNDWQDNLLMFWKDHINNSYDHPKRSWHEPEGLEGPEGFQPEDEGKLGEVALTKSYENLMLELTEMSAELILYNEEARETSLQELAISVRAGWKAAFILRHGSAVPLQTTLSPADRMEFTFVEWLFARSLARHRQARDPSLWGPVPSVKVLKVQKIESRTFLQRYMQRRGELLEQRAGQSCEALRDIRTMIGKSLQNRRSIEEVCHCPDSGVNLNEVLLFHGSPSAKINGILANGFDPRYAGEGTGAMFGQGTYFAHNASKCFRYGDDDAAETGGLRQTVLLVRALLGAPYYQDYMSPDQRMPPANSDSVVVLTRAEGGCVDHREYVLYEGASCLPVYLIDFEHLPACGCLMCGW